jgi:hypothetical protein
MRSYMLDADGSREFEPVSRISVHESTKGDGTFDHHSVFIDKLVLPRFILPLHKGAARAAGPRQFGGRGGFTMVSGFPRAYTVQVSNDGSSWSALVAEGQGARFVRITQTATPDDAPAWSIQKFRVYQPAGTQGGTR